DATIGADLHQALDRLLALAPEIALDLEVAVDVALKLRDLLVGEVAHLRVGREAENGTDLPRRRRPNAVDVGQADLEPLLIRDVDAGYACHGLPLPLLVPWIGADDHRGAVPLDHAAAFTHGLDGWSDF